MDLTRLPAERKDRRAVVEHFFDGTGASYDRVVACTTLGLDSYWKRRLLAHLPPESRSVLDLACGTGIVIRRVLERCPNAAVTGVDITEEYLEVARRRFAGGARDVRLIHGDAETVPLEGTFDAVVSSYIPKYVDAERVLANLLPHLAPGAVLSVHDFAYPNGWVQRQGWTAWMRLLATAGTRVFPAWDVAFDRRLESLIRHSRWPTLWRHALDGAGFRDIRVERLSLRMAIVVSARLRAG